ncbi:MAG: DUF935 family protein [Opitutales bacterium]|nr:DUF935 family protein [Opitutales bacterium]
MSKSHISTIRIAQEKSSRTNPLRNLTEQKLAYMLENFALGWLADAARLFEALERRDDIISAVASKRRKAVSRLNWNIVAQGDDEEKSRRHIEVLTNFYNNIRVSSISTPNKTGSVAMLFEQMLYANDYQYSVHEIIFNPTPSSLSAELRFVPLWNFEATSGALRFKKTITSSSGEEMRPREWLVCATDYPLMEPVSIAYALKRIALGDWSLFARRFGSATPVLSTNAKPQSDDWRKAEDAVANLANNLGIVIGKDDVFELIQANAQGLPFPQLVDRMDRAISTIFRGSDLSTLSAANNAGASLQGEESDILEDADCRMIEEALQHQLSQTVLDYYFGEGTVPAAYLSIQRTDRRDKKAFLELAEIMTRIGCPPSKAEIYEGAGFEMPGEGEETAAMAQPRQEPVAITNSADSGISGIKALSEAQKKDLESLVARLKQIAETSADEAEFLAALKILDDDLPKYIGGEHSAAALAGIVKKSMAIGVKTSDLKNLPQN